VYSSVRLLLKSVSNLTYNKWQVQIDALHT
jgi:hypothetical protein